VESHLTPYIHHLRVTQALAMGQAQAHRHLLVFCFVVFVGYDSVPSIVDSIQQVLVRCQVQH
jgi:hypothetical protein